MGLVDEALISILYFVYQLFVNRRCSSLVVHVVHVNFADRKMGRNEALCAMVK